MDGDRSAFRQNRGFGLPQPRPRNLAARRRTDNLVRETNLPSLEPALLKLTNGFAAYMARGKDSAKTLERYAIRVTDITLDSKDIWLSFSFRRGIRYCCDCSACHHGLLFDIDFERLRDYFRQSGIEVRRPMRIHMKLRCEVGTLFDDGPQTEKQPPAYETIEGYDQDEVYDERNAIKTNRNRERS